MILSKFSTHNAMLVASLAAAGLVSAAAKAQDAAPAAPASPHRAMLNKYCVTCHNEKLRTADLLLDQANVDNLAANPELWEKVLKKIRTGAMPPGKAPRPEPQVSDAFANYLQ